MHFALFSLKRAYQSVLAAGHILTRRFGITPARLDMLHCIQLHDRQIFRQSDLRRMLGVSSPTVSRMLKSLEDLGLVFRCIDPDDARQQNVGLTEQGRELVKAATTQLFDDAHLQLGFDVALAGDQWHDESVCLVRTRDFDALLRRVRETFFDRGTLEYPGRRRIRFHAVLLRDDPPPPRPPPPAPPWPRLEFPTPRSRRHATGPASNARSVAITDSWASSRRTSFASRDP